MLRADGRDVCGRSRGQVKRRSVLVARHDADVDLGLLIAEQHPAAGLMDRALDHGNVANPLQRGRRIRRGADDDQRLDHRLEPAHIAGDDEALDLGACGRDQQNQVVGEVDRAAERLPRVLRLQPGSATPQRGLQSQEAAC